MTTKETTGMKKTLFLAGLLLAMGAAQAGEVYRWVDKNGNVHYGDVPVDEDAEKVKITAPPPADAASAVEGVNIPYEARLVSKNFPVVLYVTEKCGDVCKRAREFLVKRKIPFSETVLKTQEEFDAFHKRTGLDAIPALSVGRNWLKGFQEQQWQSELDAAGYPK
jgi:glutaredoxin